MSTKEDKSTFLIKSMKNNSFGTGFCIYKDDKGSFLLTCAHVVESCGENDLEVDSFKSILLHSSKEDDIIDLALIYVEGLTDTVALKLSEESAKEGDSFTIDGFRPHKHNYAKEPLKGYIKKLYTLQSEENKTIIYDLGINEGDSIEQGYSGSAVISTQTGLVMAVSTDRKRDGKNAYATPIRYLKNIWKEMPLNLFKSYSMNNPYKGLNSFEYKDRHNYYGREIESKEIAEALKTTKLFTLLGASGSGKSSLIFAGVLPLIEEEGVEILSFRPQSEPFKNLASVFIPTLYPDKLEQIEQGEKLTTKLINNDIKLDNLVQTFLNDTKAKHLYLIIDQFEELFTLTKEQEKRNSFLEQLLTLVNSDLNVTLFISMRADFLSHISYYEPFNKAYNDHKSQMLSLISYENLRRIIEEPALKQGVVFQDGLVDRIIDEIEHEAGQLPLLEFALEQFWTNKKDRVISHAILDEMQSISHSISHYADKIYKDNPKYQASIKKVLIKLVNPGSGTEDTRRIASFDEFDKEARETITLLANERLIVTEDNNIDIIHEALIREWRRLQEWIENYREFLEWEKRLRDDRKFYVENGEKKEDLLRDSKLLKAEEFLKSHEEYIAPLDKVFVKKSIEVAKRKRRKRTALFAFIILFLVSVIVVIGYLGYMTSESKKVLKHQKEVIEKTQEKTQSMLYSSKVKEGILYRDYLNEPLKSKFLFSNIIKDSLTQEQEDNAKILYESTNKNNSVLTSFINESFLYQTGEQIITYKDKRVNVWDINTETIIQTFNSKIDLYNAKFNKDKSKIFIVSDNNVTSWDVTSGKLLQIFDTNISNRVRTELLLSSNETKLFVVNYNTVKIYDSCSGKFLKKKKNVIISTSMNMKKMSFVRNKSYDNNRSIEILEMDSLETHLYSNNKFMVDSWINNDGSRFFGFYRDDNFQGFIKVLDIDNGKTLKKYKLHFDRSYFYKFIITKDESKMLFWDDKTIEILDIKTGKILKKIITKSKIKSVIFDKKERRILSNHYNGNLNIWNVDNGTLLNTLKHDSAHTVIFSKDGSKILSCAKNSLKFWKINNKEKIEILNNNYKYLFKNKMMFVSRDWNENNYTITDISTGKSIKTFPRSLGFKRFTFNNNETKVILYGKESLKTDNVIKLWDIEHNKLLQTFDDKSSTNSIFNPDETKILTWKRNEKIIKIWDVKSGKLLEELKSNLSIKSIIFLDKRKILIDSEWGRLKILDIDSKKTIQKIGDYYTKLLKLNKDKSKLLLSNFSSIKLLNIQKNEVLHVFKLKNIEGAIFNADESKILCWSSYGMIRVIDANSGKVLQSLKHTDVKGALWNKDENKVLSWGGNNVKLWDMTNLQLLLSLSYSSIRGRVVFSKDERKIYFLHGSSLKEYILYPQTSIRKEDYSLKDEVEKGLYLNSFDELEMIDIEKWMKKKKKYNKVLNTLPKSKKITFQKNKNFYYIKGKNEFYKKQYSKAILSYEKALSISPRDYVYVALGDVYYSKEEYSLARENYEKALDSLTINTNSRNFDLYDIYIKLGWIYYDAKEYTLARKNYKKAITLKPDDDGNYLNLFEIELIQNKFFTPELELNYIKRFQNRKESFVYYEMLKVFQNIVNGKTSKLEDWKQKYSDVELNWNFDDLEEWIERIKDNNIKSRLMEALKIFKRHLAKLTLQPPYLYQN